MTTRVYIDEHASLLKRSTYYKLFQDEDRQKKRSIELWAVKALPCCFYGMLATHDSQCNLFQR